MKIIGLLVATALLALGCDQDQDIGGNQGGSGGGGEPVDSCQGAECGARCIACGPNDPDCVDATATGYCSDGVCLPEQPQCGPFCGDGTVNLDSEECDDGNQADGDGCTGNCTLESDQNPCAGRACGATCLTCPPNEPECLDPSYQGYCDIQSLCVPDIPPCQ